MTRVVLLGLLVLMLVGALGAAVTPDERTELPPAQRTYRGVVHVHSSVSHDAEQSIEEIAAAAHEAQLNFVVLADHNKAALPKPAYYGDVLIIPSIEVSTDQGHVLVLGGAGAGEGFKQVEDARAHGAFVVGAHPDSLKHGLDDETLVQLQGYELLSTSSDFYRVLRSSLGLGFLRYPFGRRQALAAMYPAVTPSLERFDRLAADRSLVFTCGVDDHGRIKHALRLETYVTYLPTMLPDMDAVPDAAGIIERLREGRSYCALGLFGDASALSVTLRAAGHMGSTGDTAPAPAKLLVRWNAPLPPDQEFVITRDGKEIKRESARTLDLDLTEVGRYRVDVERSVPSWAFFRRRVRWIYGNPFWIEGRAG